MKGARRAQHRLHDFIRVNSGKAEPAIGTGGPRGRPSIRGQGARGGGPERHGGHRGMWGPSVRPPWVLRRSLQCTGLSDFPRRTRPVRFTACHLRSRKLFSNISSRGGDTLVAQVRRARPSPPPRALIATGATAVTCLRAFPLPSTETEAPRGQGSCPLSLMTCDKRRGSLFPWNRAPGRKTATLAERAAGEGGPAGHR